MILDFIRELGGWALVGRRRWSCLPSRSSCRATSSSGSGSPRSSPAPSALVADISWQIQLILFVAALAGPRHRRPALVRPRRGSSEEPLLNERATRLVGQSYVLGDPIVDGTGRVSIDDTMWRLTGPDLPSGTKVRIVGHDGSVLSGSAGRGVG